MLQSERPPAKRGGFDLRVIVILAFALLLATALATSQQPPASAIALLSAVASGEVEAARRTLTSDALIGDSSSGRSTQSSLEAFMGNIRGCTQVALSWENIDEGRGAGRVSWRCPSRQRTHALIWTDARGVVFIQFGLPAQE